MISDTTIAAARTQGCALEIFILSLLIGGLANMIAKLGGLDLSGRAYQLADNQQKGGGTRYSYLLGMCVLISIALGFPKTAPNQAKSTQTCSL